MSGRNPDDARHEDCGLAEVEHDLSEPDIDDHTAPCMRCDDIIDLDDHGYKPDPTSGEYLCEDCRDEDPVESERAADLESAFDAVLVELDRERDTIETPPPVCEDDRCPQCKAPDEAINHVSGCVFVGWGVGWQSCAYCNGTGKVQS